MCSLPFFFLLKKLNIPKGNLPALKGIPALSVNLKHLHFPWCPYFHSPVKVLDDHVVEQKKYERMKMQAAKKNFYPLHEQVGTAGCWSLSFIAPFRIREESTWVFKGGAWLARFIWIAALSLLVETEKRSASPAKRQLIDGSGWKEQLHNFVPDLLTLGEEGLTAAFTAISILGKTTLS